jgi:RNA polymerase sigma-54 factor
VVGQRLEIRQGQGLVITPQLQQAIKLLQLSNQELDEYVEAELEKNPLLQRDETEAGRARGRRRPCPSVVEVAESAELSFSEGRGLRRGRLVDARRRDVYGDATRASAPGIDRCPTTAQPGLGLVERGQGRIGLLGRRGRRTPGPARATLWEHLQAQASSGGVRRHRPRHRPEPDRRSTRAAICAANWPRSPTVWAAVWNGSRRC